MNRLFCELLVYEPNQEPRTINFLVDKKDTRNNLYPVFHEDGTLNKNFNLFIETAQNEINSSLISQSPVCPSPEQSSLRKCKKFKENALRRCSSEIQNQSSWKKQCTMSPMTEEFQVSKEAQKLLNKFETANIDEKSEKKISKKKMLREKKKTKKFKAKLRKQKNKAVKRFFAGEIDYSVDSHSYPNSSFQQQDSTLGNGQPKVNAKHPHSRMTQMSVSEKFCQNNETPEFKSQIKSNSRMNRRKRKKLRKQVTVIEKESVSELEKCTRPSRTFSNKVNSNTELFAPSMHMKNSPCIAPPRVNSDDPSLKWNPESRSPAPDFIPLTINSQSSLSTSSSTRIRKSNNFVKKNTTCNEPQEFIGISQRAYFLNQ